MPIWRESAPRQDNEDFPAGDVVAIDDDLGTLKVIKELLRPIG